jgi:undecaprenyl-diphosphatase
MPSVLRFVARHAWSISLSALSAFSFWRLAREMAEGELDPFDRAVAQLVVRSRGDWDGAMLALTRLGTLRSLTILTSLAAAGLVLRGKRWEAAYVVACAAGAGLWCWALKLLFQRVRPGESGLYVLSLPSSFSFPSGHAMGAAGVLGSFVIVVFAMPAARLWRWPALGVALPLIFGVAASRVYFGVHYPSDIVGGQLAAAAWVAAVTGWFYPRLLPAEASLRP